MQIRLHTEAVTAFVRRLPRRIRLRSGRAGALFVIILAACASGPPAADLRTLYGRAARTHDDLRNPVILIPGLMGSRLADADGATVWGRLRDSDAADPNHPDGARRFALPMAEGESLYALRDSVRAVGPLDHLEIRVMGMSIAFDAYVDILGALGVGGYRSRRSDEAGELDYGPDHFTCFEFAYDWRRSNADNAGRLHAFMLERKEEVAREIERRYGITDHEVRFDIVAHSMGALLTRYYLRYGGAPLPALADVPPPTWAGAELVERAILVAPPNAGAPQILDDLLEGKDLGFLLPHYPAALLGTLPSVYELMPRPRHQRVVDASGEAIDALYEVETWEERGWGLADPDQDEVLRRLLPEVEDVTARRRIALDHLRKCLDNAKRFALALDRPAAPPSGLQIDLIAGDAHPTPSRVRIARGDFEVVERGPGDGTVLRSSALMDERVGGVWQSRLVSPVSWQQVVFLPSSHIELTKDPAFIDNLLFTLLEAPR